MHGQHVLVDCTIVDVIGAVGHVRMRIVTVSNIFIVVVMMSVMVMMMPMSRTPRLARALFVAVDL
jgi:hypothetical protein